MELYYYHHMSPLEQEVYRALREGLSQVRPTVVVPRLEGKALGEVLFKLRLDLPELFYVTGFSYRFHPAGSHVEVLPEYLFPKAKVLTHQKAIQARVERLCRPLQKKSPWEQAEAIHDLLCTTVHYDKLKKPYSHEVIGPLTQGVGVCEGIAKSVKLLCDTLGIWCILVLSEADPEHGVKYRHAWNIVKLGGQYYHLDATFDNTLSQGGELRRDYLFLDDKRAFRDHLPALYPVPACTDSGKFYYKTAKRSFTKPEEVASRARQAMRKDQTLVFHWRGGPLTADVLGELVKLLEDTAREKDRHARIQVNRPQAVFQVTFPKEEVAAAVVEEEANEGESL